MAIAKGQPNVIYVDGQPYYTLTPEDKLWMARMLRGEGTDWAAQLWTIAQRYVYRAERYEDSVAELVLEFSQPVDEQWTRTGSACRPGGTHDGTEACSPARLDRRDGYRSLQPSQLQRELAFIERWAQGKVPNPVPRSMDWHATNLKPGYTRIGRYPNVFQASPQAMRWPANKVTVGGAGAGWSPAVKLFIGIGGLAFVGGGAYWWSSRA